MNRAIEHGYSCMEEMVLVEKFEDVLQYLYPIAKNIRRDDHVFQDRLLDLLYAQIEKFHAAGKTRQPSRLYLADAGLATLRSHLRFMVHPSRRFLTPHQHKVAEVLVTEVGKMHGAWIKKLKKEAQERKNRDAKG